MSQGNGSSNGGSSNGSSGSSGTGEGGLTPVSRVQVGSGPAGAGDGGPQEGRPLWLAALGFTAILVTGTLAIGSGLMLALLPAAPERPLVSSPMVVTRVDAPQGQALARYDAFGKIYAGDAPEQGATPLMLYDPAGGQVSAGDGTPLGRVKPGEGNRAHITLPDGRRWGAMTPDGQLYQDGDLIAEVDLDGTITLEGEVWGKVLNYGGPPADLLALTAWLVFSGEFVAGDER